MSESSGHSDHRVRLQNAVLGLKKLQAQVDALEAAKREPIAIVGMGCRIPGDANTPEAFWRILHLGIDTAGELPGDRWDAAPLLDADPYTPGKMFTRYGNFLSDISSFDSQFFGIAPREAASLDPQQRLLLEVSWEALEHAGQAPDALAGSRTGIFVGVSVDDYAQFHLRSGDYTRIDAYTCSGAGLCFGAGRLSYVLGLHGPCMTVDTACSSALTAIHLASHSLRLGECDLALAGGINLILTPEVSIGMSALHALSPDGRSKAFDASADGFGRGEACGVVVLKRLSTALAARDNILALIRGSAMNHDGASGGLMVPNGLAQQSLLREALARADIKAADVDYVDAHGTGTALGDPIELEALAAVMGEGRPADRPLVVGSVKTNIGHPEAASGVIGVIKVALALQHEEIPPHLHLRRPSLHIPWDRLPVIIPTSPLPWPAGARRRIAGVSAFGMSGTNVHVVLEEAPRPAAASQSVASTERPLHLLRLSAKTPAALRDIAVQLERHLDQHEDLALADVCYSANIGRAHFPHRAAIMAATTAEARTRLAAFASGQETYGVWHRQIERGDRPKVAFLFTGQGSQYVGMGRQLYATHPAFRAALDRCDELLRPHLEWPLLTVLFGEPGAPALLDETAYTQPALFALEYALAQLWRSWGVEPAAVLGYSVGEYAAACIAGVFSLEDGLKLIATRGQLMQALPPDGGMAAIFASEALVAGALKPYAGAVAIAAINGPAETVISGAREAVQAVLDAFQSAGVNGQRLVVSHAFHSPLVEPMLDDFASAAAGVSHAAPRIGLVSNLTGRLLAASDSIGAGYWRRHAREPVQFVAGIQTLYDEGIRLFVEVGPRPTLSGIGKSVLPESAAVWLPSLRKRQDEWPQMLQSLAALHLHGVRVDWAGFDREYPRQRVALPTYPFQRTPFRTPFQTSFRTTFPTTRPARLASQSQSQSETPLHPLLHRRIPMPLRERVFEVAITPDSPSFLADHRVQGSIVLPATAYLEMILAAAMEVLGPGPRQLESVRFEEALVLSDVLSDAQPQIVQVVLTPETGSDMRFEICRREDGAESADVIWRRLVSGKLRSGSSFQPDTVQLDALQARCSQDVPVDAYYGRLAKQGLEYGANFRGLRQLHRGAAEALGSIELPEPLIADSAAYHCHPALLDAALQVMAACVEDESTEGRHYMPVAIDRFCVLGRPGTHVWSYASTRPGADGTGATGDVQLLDATGQVVAIVQGLHVRQTHRAATAGVSPQGPNPFYEVQWRSQDLVGAIAGNTRVHPRNWLILADHDGVAAALSARLEASGATCTVIPEGGSRSPLDSQPSVDSVETSHAVADGVPPDVPGSLAYDGVVYLSGLDREVSETMQGDAVHRAAVDGCAGALRLVQRLAGSSASAAPRLWIVTRGAQAIGAANDVVKPAQAPLWGLGSVIALEHPSVRCVLVDLDPLQTADPLPALMAELSADDLDGKEQEPGGAGRENSRENSSENSRENRIAWRAGKRYVARLVSRPGRATGSIAAAAVLPLRLELSQHGVLDSLAWQPTAASLPGPGEVSIRVRATSLNFRDVLNALGMYPGDAGPLGDECAGTIMATGPGVSDYAAGDEVVALASGSFQTHVTTPQTFVVRRPAQLPVEAAVALPIAYLTALYGLRHLARLAPGDRVLIHAAAGGVGLAAVRVAQKVGAEIFATAGSPEKRSFLQAQGVIHVLDSRSLDFAGEVRTRTGGRGVDVVLNSLSGEFIGESFGVLAPRGRFVEIGKRDIWTAEQVAAVHPTAEYYPFHLGTLMETQPALVRQLMFEILTEVAAGSLPRLPHREFAAADAVAAFREMAQARHIGKIVVTQPSPLEIRSDRTYLVTGGLGALGLRVAVWLVARGARHLLLLGRKGADAAAQETLRQLEAAGARIMVAAADVTRREDLSEILAAAERSMPPIAGVVHAAGVLDDGVLIHQDSSRLAQVMGPKVAGAWNLHELTRTQPLDFFVLFSSIVAIAGTPGQGNYAAANAFLDALAHHRRSLGMPALSVNWGAWADAGMASQLSSRDQRRWTDQGIILIQPEQGLDAMEELLAQGATQASVLPIDWTRFLGQFPRDAEPLLYAEVTRHKSSKQRADSSPKLLQQLKETVPNQRRPLLIAYVRSLVVQALGLDPAQTVDYQQPLSELGLDSLMAVEIRNALGIPLGQTLPVSLLYDYPTIEALTAYLAQQIPGFERDITPPAAPPSHDGQAMTTLQQATEAEAEALLLKELEALNF